MREITKSVFIANDGKEFLDKVTCQRYEQRQALKAIIDANTVYQTEIHDMNGLINAILEWVSAPQ